MALLGILGRKMGKSRIAGIIAASLAAGWELMIQEDRRGAPNSLWLLLTLLGFVFLIQARDEKKYRFLHLATACCIGSFLTKYSSVPILGLPFLYTFAYFRSSGRRVLIGSFIVWTTLLILLFLWLIIDYHIISITHTPGTQTNSLIQNSGGIGFQTIASNWSLLAKATGSVWYLYISGGVVVFSTISLLARYSIKELDTSSVVVQSVFDLAFYLLMSLFVATEANKWMVVGASIYLLTGIGIAALLKALLSSIKYLNLPDSPQISGITLGIGATLFLLLYFGGLGENAINTYNKVWSKPLTYNVLSSWFEKNVPEGARAVTEVVKLPYNFPYSPNNVHNRVVDSIFEYPLIDYREQGYEYLIWNDIKSGQSDTLTDLNARENSLLEQNSREVLRLTGDIFSGPNIVVFRIPPIQQYPLYAWFTSAVSFRGYDLNQTTFKPGDEVRLMLYWESAETTQSNYIIFVHILDLQTGKLIAGQDGPPDYGNTPTWKWQGDMQFIRDQRVLTIPADAPPGVYTLRIGLYDANTHQRVQVTDLKNQPVGDTLVLQQVKIQP